MAPKRTPPYMLLGDFLPSKLTRNILGRIVRDMRYPNDEYIPDQPQKLFGEAEVFEVVDSNVTVTLEANKGRTVEGRLKSFFNVNIAKDNDAGTKISGKRVITRSLSQHPKCFSKIYGAHKAELLDMLRSERCKGVAYMAVAIKSCVDAEVERQRGNASTILIDADIPVAQIANAALAAPIIPIDINPGGSIERRFEESWLQKNFAEGERVFAVRYKKIMLKKAWHRWTQEVRAEYGDQATVEWGDGIFAGREHDADDYVDEDEESDEDMSWLDELEFHDVVHETMKAIGVEPIEDCISLQGP